MISVYLLLDFDSTHLHIVRHRDIEKAVSSISFDR